MSMKDGIRNMVFGALDTHTETASQLITGGLDPEQAVKAANILTKSVVADLLDKNLGNLDAASFTHGLRTQSDKPFFN